MTNKNFPPGPKPWFPLGIYFSLHDPLKFYKGNIAKHGDIVHIKLGGTRHYVLLNKPEHIKQVLTLDESQAFQSVPYAIRCLLNQGLIVSQNDLHRQQRRLLHPFFQKQQISPWAPTIVSCTENIMKTWKDGDAIDVSAQMTRLTLAIILRVLVGSTNTKMEEEIIEAFHVIVEMTHRNGVPYMDKLLEKLPLPSNIRYRQALKTLDGIIQDLIDRHRSQPSAETDMIAYLLKAKADQPENAQLSLQQIRDEIMTILIAGHETTANVLSFAWYLLSKSPQAEADFHHELQMVLQSRLPTVEDIKNLTFTRQIFLETMRLYPPVWLISRRPTKDMEIGGYHIPAWSSINVCTYVTHRDPRYFSDPDTFLPQRWSSKAARSFTYFPFGGGVRQCIGEGFAFLEAILILATMGQTWKLHYESSSPLKLDPIYTLRPKHGLPMRLNLRNKN